MNIYPFIITIRINWKAAWKNCTNILSRKNATSVAHYIQDSRLSRKFCYEFPQ